MADISNTDSVARIFALSALDGTQTSTTITVGQDIGGYSAGDVIPAGSNVNEVLATLLTGSSPTTQITIYYGATTNIPTSLTGLTSQTVASTTLIGEYTQKITAGDPETLKGQYPCFAVPLGYEITKWCVPEFKYNIPHSLVVTENYNLYYLNDPSYDYDEGGITYLITVAVAS